MFQNIAKDFEETQIKNKTEKKFPALCQCHPYLNDIGHFARNFFLMQISMDKYISKY